MNANIVFLLGASICLSLAHPGSAIGSEKYCNLEYGYCLLIPKGQAKLTDLPPTPQHGLRLVLDNNPAYYIWTDGSYNTLHWSTLEEVVDAQVEWLRQESSMLRVISRQRAVLNRLRAMRVIIRYNKTDTGEAMIQDLIIAQRTRENEIGIVYTVGLRTSAARYEGDKSGFERIIKSWTLTTLPH